MQSPLRIALYMVLVIKLSLFFSLVMPSLIGFLLAMLLVICVSDIFTRRYQQAAKTFNSAALAVCQQQGAIGKVATAFARSGPLQGPCYEFARRLMVGEDPIQAAVSSRVPLRLTTAVAMQTGRTVQSNLNGRKPGSSGEKDYPLIADDSSVMPAYAQLMYLVITALVTTLALSFTSVFIVPTIEKMMEEFGLRSPSTLLTTGSVPMRFALVGLIGFLVFVSAAINWGNIFGIRLPRWLPVSPRLVEHKSDTLEGLADAIDAGMTVDQALDLGAQISLSNHDRRSLEYANHLIRQGASPAQGLRQSGWLSSREHDWLLGATATRGAELLRTIAAQRVRDAHANMRWTMGIIFPVVILFLGLVVLAYSFGFFGSLISLISGLS